MKRWLTVFLVLFLALSTVMLCGCVGTSEETEESSGEELLVYCGAGMREPMDEIAMIFEEKEGIPVRYTYGGSAQLLSQIELYQEGDAYMPGALSYIQSAMDKGYVDKTKDLVYHVMTIAVPKGNPACVESLEDLAKTGVRVGLGDPEGPAIGKTAKKVLQNNDLWDSVSENVVSYAATVNELIVYISMDQADAALIWEDLYNPESMEIIDIPADENAGGIKVVPIGTLTFSKDKVNAEKFINFVASDDGKAVFEKHGFTLYPDPKYE